jgi:alpha-amylase
MHPVDPLAPDRPRAQRRWLAVVAVLFALPLGAHPATAQAAPAAPGAPAWTRGATCYEVFIRSFADANGDGIGDLRGLTARLDYINDGRPASAHSLGARCIWLMPVAESPSYHGYDVSDYYRVERDYGTNADFQRFMHEAHRRGIRVLVDMVLNHTSRDNPWFVAASRDTLSPFRSWYRFAAPKPAGRGPWGQDVWMKSPVRDEYYYAVFSSHMPDLDYANPAVLAEAKKIATFWLERMHVDGFRLDAVRYLVEDHGLLQDSPGTHEVLRSYQAYLRGVRPDVFTVGEVYAPVDTVLPYYPDQLTSYFAFEVADSLIAGVARGSAAHLLDPALHLQRDVPAGRWSPFLGNHDQPRVRTQLGGNPAKARVAAVLLLTMPGMPFVYYGEEIGMTGAKPDERLRTPMQWTAGHADGFSTGTPWQRLADDSATVTVAAQDGDPRSLLTLYRRLIHLRQHHSALSLGRIVPLTASADAVAAYLRIDGDHVALILANLGATALRDVTVETTVDVLSAGRWIPRDLLGWAGAAAFDVAPDGRVRAFVPVDSLPPNTAFVFELRRAADPAR